MPRVEKPKNDLRVPEWHSQKGKWSLNFEGKQCDQDKMDGFMFIYIYLKIGGIISVRQEAFRRNKRPSVNIVAEMRRRESGREVYGAGSSKLQEFIQPLARVGWGGEREGGGVELRCNKCS